MQFNSAEFLVFFAAVAAGCFALRRGQGLLLLAASYYFYMAWRPAYLLLILASTLLDYAAALLMARSSVPWRRRACLAVSLVGNLGLLFTFKYFAFFTDSLASLGALAGLDWRPPMLDVVLPVGISFYTFQTLSYTIEVYRGRQPAERRLTRFALYVAFFPQLVAGPIERPQNLLPQLAQPHAFEYGRVRDGLLLMLWGLFKKVVVADRLAVVVEQCYGAPERYPGPILAIATVFFAFQIYGDFSGYSDIAIGAARVLGVDLMKNFNRPYIAQSMAEFWRRWHISLSTWFRDYVYLPLGGRRAGSTRWAFNILVVFFVSGLWHGAHWRFVIWGALHGVFYLAEQLTAAPRAWAAARLGLARAPRLRAAGRIAVTFTLVCLAWIFFRAHDARQALYILTKLPTGWESFAAYGGFARIIQSMDISVAAFAVNAAAIAGLLLVERLHGDATIVELVTPRPAWQRWAVYIALAMAIMNLGVAEEIPFVYFQF